MSEKSATGHVWTYSGTAVDVTNPARKRTTPWYWRAVGVQIRQSPLGDRNRRRKLPARTPEVCFGSRALGATALRHSRS